MPNEPSRSTLAALALRADRHDRAAREELFVTLYAELHKLAESHIRRQAGNVTLGATTLLHEAYLDISRRDALAFPDRHRFFAYASRAMRGLVIDYIRTRRAEKRGGALTFTTLDERHAVADGRDERIERLRAALEQLEAIDPALAELVDLKFFCGFTFTEIAAMRGSSERSIQREWAKARLLLHDLVDGDPDEG